MMFLQTVNSKYEVKAADTKDCGDKAYTGINIQWPISDLILKGKKTIETRTYPIPPKFVGQELVLIETPGKKGGFDARMVAIIVFGESFKYPSEKAFYKDTKKHGVTPDSEWAWKKDIGKWGWPIKSIKVFKKPTPVPKDKRGIRYRSELKV